MAVCMEGGTEKGRKRQGAGAATDAFRTEKQPETEDGGEQEEGTAEGWKDHGAVLRGGSRGWARQSAPRGMLQREHCRESWSAAGDVKWLGAS